MGVGGTKINKLLNKSVTSSNKRKQQCRVCNLMVYKKKLDSLLGIKVRQGKIKYDLTDLYWMNMYVRVVAFKDTFNISLSFLEL